MKLICLITAFAGILGAQPIVDDNGVIITGCGAACDALLGPQIPIGNSPWPYADKAEDGDGAHQGIATSIYTAALNNPPSLSTPLTGTVAINGSPGGLVGTGTHFTTELSVGDPIVVAWNPPGEAVGSGRYTDTVSAIADDTHLTFTTYQNNRPAQSGLTAYKLPAQTGKFQFNMWGIGGTGGGNSWNYYDVVIALYRLYYRTLDTAYLTAARSMADYWWQWAVDHGLMQSEPIRGLSLMGMYMRALDGRPEMFPGLYTMASWYADQEALKHPEWDSRDAGVAQWQIAEGATTDPDAIRHAAYCAFLGSRTKPIWIDSFFSQENGGFWDENLFFYSLGLPYKDPPGGASPWRSDWHIRALMLTYDVLNNTTPNDPGISAGGCNNQALAAQLLPVLISSVDWVWNYGRSDPTLGGNHGLFYEVGYESNGLLGVVGAGTVSVSLTSSTVTGSGTNFQADFAPCDGSTYMGIQNSNFRSTRTVYKVLSCQSATTLTIDQPYGSQGETNGGAGIPYSSAPGMWTKCASLSAYCWSGGGGLVPPQGDLNLIRSVVGMQGWAWYQTGDVKYVRRGDELFAEFARGSSGGPYDRVHPCAGPEGLCYGSYGDVDNWAISLDSGSCGNGCGVGPFTGQGKNYAQASGSPCAQCYLAYRLMPAIGGTQPPTSGGRVPKGNVAKKGNRR